MEFEKIKNKGQARLFKSDFLEMMTKTHPVVVYTMYFPVIFFMLYFGIREKGIAPAAECLVFGLGLLFWSLFEYIMHRYIFHMLVHSPVAKRIVYTMHGVHHEYPRDKDRLFMPPVPSIILATIIFYTFYLALGWYALCFFPGFLFGYIVYGSMHFAIHAYTPPRFLKALWRNHHLHHYKYPNKGFGVSSVLWDVIFGTVPQKEESAQGKTSAVAK